MTTSTVPPLQLPSSLAPAVSIPTSPDRLVKPKDLSLQLSVNLKEQLENPLPSPLLKAPPSAPTESEKIDWKVLNLFPNPPTQQTVYKQAANRHAALQEALQSLEVRDPSLAGSEDIYISERRLKEKRPNPMNQKYQPPITREKRQRSQFTIDNIHARPESDTIPMDQLPQLIMKYRTRESESPVGEIRRVHGRQRNIESKINAALPSAVIFR
ncbi:uncharacterized protein DFL_003732 [Arthrobotrys flagrans]|uniref:Uncharacterized protein n=1 Tax=Arthrobotrys flagrans TaxID=97331 RepID=A0A437A2P3_ARTFL|nr:hypothetical protein DFL_003732 [Arthrobotrys flagrans]